MALATGGAALTATAQALASATASRGIHTVLYDARYSDAREFAHALVRRGAAAFATHQDVVPLWYERVKGRTAPPFRLGGLTPHSDLVLLEQCAAASGLALLYQGMHDARGATTVTHSLRARGGFTDAASAAVFSAGPRWPAALAAALNAALLEGVWAPSLRAAGGAPRAADHPGTLTSWVLGAA